MSVQIKPPVRHEAMRIADVIMSFPSLLLAVVVGLSGNTDRAGYYVAAVGAGDRDAVRHQLHEVAPHRVPLASAQEPPLHEGVEVVPEQHLRPVHVPDTRQDGLIHQKCRDRPGRTMDPAPGKIRIGVCPQRVGTQHRQLRGNLGPRPQGTQLGPT